MGRLLRLLFLGLVGIFSTACVEVDPLNYDKMIHLDVEDLSEEGMKKAYLRVLPSLSKIVKQPHDMQELIDNESNYFVIANNIRYEICIQNKHSGGDCWVNAALAFFDIVNKQLVNTPYRFYAFYSDNDFSGMFLTEHEFAEAVKGIKQKSSQPYILVNEPPYYGRAH
jgi:hypothetical protein